MKQAKVSKKLLLSLLTIFIVLIAVIAAATPTLAYYIRTTDKVEGEFGPADPYTIEFPDEDLDELQIEIVGVENNNYPVFVRAIVIVNWKKHTPCTCGDECSCNEDAECDMLECPLCSKSDDEDNEGTVHYVSPTPGIDYEISFNTDNWSKLDYYYYCTTPINPNNGNGYKLTPVFINSFTSLNSQPPKEGYVLNVEIIVQTIQAVGATAEGKLAWQDAWGLTTINPPAKG